MIRPFRLLDLFCGAGGCAVGYSRAGFEVVGVDSVKQPSYPFEYNCCDAVQFVERYGGCFDVIHASPPCQAHSTGRHIHGYKHHDFIPETRKALIMTGKPYVIENVMGAPLHHPIMLCGLSFGLRVYRHRLFESNLPVLSPSHIKHDRAMTTNASKGYSKDTPMICVAGENFSRVQGAEAMGIDWMKTRRELAQAIPPAYTSFIGRQLIEMLKQSHAA